MRRVRCAAQRRRLPPAGHRVREGAARSEAGDAAALPRRGRVTSRLGEQVCPLEFAGCGGRRRLDHRRWRPGRRLDHRRWRPGRQ